MSAATDAIPAPARSALRHLPLAVGAVLAATAVCILAEAAGAIHPQAVAAAVATTPARVIAAALISTLVSFAALAVYDMVAVRTIAPGRVPPVRAAAVGAAGYAVSNALGFPLVTGGAVRYRLYAAEGLSPADIGRVVANSWLSLWLAFAVIASATALLDPAPIAALPGVPAALPRAAGLGLLAAVAAFLAWLSGGARQFRLAGVSSPLPSGRAALVQLLAGIVDVSAAAATLYVVLPAGSVPSLPLFLVVFVAAVILGIAGHTPGGIGVFEAAILGGLGIGGRADAVAGLLVYRAVYTVLPLAIATTGLAAFEIRQRRDGLSAKARKARDLVAPFAPRLAALLTFASGLVLLVSGSTPGVAGRLDTLSDLLPLPFVEASHLLASLVGALLLVIARGLARRLARAHAAAMALLLAGAVFSLVKGLDVEEAGLLLAVAAALAAFRTSFYRRPFANPFALGPVSALAAAAGAIGAMWIGFAVYRYVGYSNDLWWQFGWEADAPRFLRASVAVAALLALVAVDAFLHRGGVARGEADPITPEIERLVDASPDTQAALALLGDKRFLAHASGEAFLMYAEKGRSLIALGDPVGDADAGRELVWQFREMADRRDARVLFYGVEPASLPLYLDMGLQVLKLGEVARVDLSAFGLAGSARQELRYVDRRADKEGLVLDIVPKADVPALIPVLREISDAWLDLKSGAEKGFSLGFFDPAYLARFDCAVVRKDGEIVAFANLWRGAGLHEVTVDLMRYRPGVSKIIMDALFVKLMLWGKAEGYRWFNLGAAPLAGLANHPLAPRWHRFGSVLFRRGGRLYQFEGLRAFKQKFQPVWTPHYLAAPGGLDLPTALLDVTALINGTSWKALRP